MESLVGETVNYAIEFDTETSDSNDTPTGYPMPILASGSFVVGDSQEISAPISYTYTGDGFQQTFAGTATIDLEASTLTVGFSGTAQAYDLKFTLSNLAQGSVPAITGATQTGSSGVESGVNSQLSPTFTNTSVTTGFDFLGFQPGTAISQTDQLTFGAGSPEISSATYDAAVGQLVVTGSDFTTSPSDFNTTGLTVTGEDGSTYTLSGGSVVAGAPTSTSFTVNLNAADQLAVDGLLNTDGTTSTGNDVFASGPTDFRIAGDTSFDTGATASSGGINVSNAQTPTIASVSYNNQTGVLTLNGSGFENNGQYGGINLGQITLTGGNDQTFTFNAKDYASVDSTTQAVIDLSNTTSGLNSQLVMSGEEASVNALFDQEGSSSAEGTLYNFAATSGWDSGAGPAVSTPSAVVNCYVGGTHILTTSGDRPVEDLAVGDIVVTASGEHRLIRWIGHRSLNLTRHRDPKTVWPVRVQAGAFGAGRPSRDLWMSPGHNVFVEGVLMPVRVLINGATIVQVPVDAVTYWHVELDSHDVILAESLPAESYLDTGNRTAFANGGSFVEAHPDFEARGEAETCAPLVKSGPAVAAAKAALLARAETLGHTTTDRHDLYALADGRRIEPIDLGNRRFAFTLPAGSEAIALVSRHFVPAHVKPESSDTRLLGVSVARLQVDGEDVDVRGPLGEGWHAPEQRPGHVRRWTAGTARLPAGSRLVVVDLVGEGHYPVERTDSAVAARA